MLVKITPITQWWIWFGGPVPKDYRLPCPHGWCCLVPVLVRHGGHSVLPLLHSIYARFLVLSSINSLTGSVLKNCSTTTSIGTGRGTYLRKKAYKVVDDSFWLFGWDPLRDNKFLVVKGVASNVLENSFKGCKIISSIQHRNISPLAMSIFYMSFTFLQFFQIQFRSE